MPSSFSYWLAPFLLLPALIACSGPETSLPPPSRDYLQISGIYPHLAAYNQPADTAARAGHHEAGIGAVVPWAGYLWYITYPPHQRTGSNDKLHRVDEHMNLSIRPESVGGTHANRMIHRESQQLIIGPYFIDSVAGVRAADVHQLEGRMTATTRHLFRPDSMVYFYDMEGMVYEVNVYSLNVKRLFEKPVPGWHGKGAYVGQGRLIVANNGEHQGHPMGYSRLLAGGEAKSPEEEGVLAEWNGERWKIIERKKFTDVTGPGGLYGNPDDTAPVWSMGWDKRSVILKLLDGGVWYTYRLPKASHTFDPGHGWFTEWPRIRAISSDRLMMAMHATLFDFPGTFSRANNAGISPISTHLRYIPDFGYWNDRVFLAADDASRMQNPIVGQPQSNIWFGTEDQLEAFGPKMGWGGPWVSDPVKAGQASDPYLLQGYGQRVIHLSHNLGRPVTFTLEIDREGNNTWEAFRDIAVDASGYRAHILPSDIGGAWMRLVPSRDCRATAYLHYYTPPTGNNATGLFGSLADIGDDAAASSGLIRPAGHNRSLQWLLTDADNAYIEVSLNAAGTDFRFDAAASPRVEEVRHTARLRDQPYVVDEASVVVTDISGRRFRLPKGNPAYDELWSLGKPRALREVQSERHLANIHGMFYEIPRIEGANNHEPDYQKIKPVARHDKKITDYCSWRGLLVLTGVRENAAEDGHVFYDDERRGLWFGNIDDLWKFGKPTGIGGPWKNAPVQAGVPSDPYIMTGFDRKKVELSHDAPLSVTVALEVAIHHGEEAWHTFQLVEVPAGELVTYTFPEGFQAHWVRVRADRDCQATATFIYE